MTAGGGGRPPRRALPLQPPAVRWPRPPLLTMVTPALVLALVLLARAESAATQFDVVGRLARPKAFRGIGGSTNAPDTDGCVGGSGPGGGGGGGGGGAGAARASLQRTGFGRAGGEAAASGGAAAWQGQAAAGQTEPRAPAAGTQPSRMCVHGCVGMPMPASTQQPSPAMQIHIEYLWTPNLA
mmetsp:Transcript_42161/g.126244  ORF Transcript_42161/g.126244 Transcript_42161/m.126244 type:complete len:183 (-) Transcript_42161:870-1418(-)|eukprot:365698-Chlamydomonas_euryale.AAC.5